MKTKILYIAVGFLMVLTNVALAQAKPKGWFVAGSRANEYAASIDRDGPRSGKGSAHLKSSGLKTTGFGTLMQTFQAGDFRGKRVRLSGYARSKDVKDWAGLWMRVDGPGGKSLAFDNMQDRPIKGTTEWTKYEIVLDVSAPAEQIAYGILLTGGGDVWMDDLKFEVVGNATAGTAPSTGKEIPAAPINLDFEQN